MHIYNKITISQYSHPFKNWYILLMSSRKRMSLNKTWLPNHRKLFSRDLPVCKSKTNVLQIYTDTKRTNSKRIKTKTKNTDEALYILHDNSLRVFSASEGQKELNYSFQKLFVRAVGSDSSEFASVRTHQHMYHVVALIWDALAALEMPHEHLHSKPMLYPQSWVFQCLFYPKNQIFCHQCGLNIYFTGSLLKGVHSNFNSCLVFIRKVNSTHHFQRYSTHSANQFSSDSIYQNMSYPIFFFPRIEKSKPISVENLLFQWIESLYIHSFRSPRYTQPTLFG